VNLTKCTHQQSVYIATSTVTYSINFLDTIMNLKTKGTKTKGK